MIVVVSMSKFEQINDYNQQSSDSKILVAESGA